MQIYSSIYLLAGKKSHLTVEKSVDVFQCHTACYYQSKNMFSHYFIFEQSPLIHMSNLIKTWNLY